MVTQRTYSILTKIIFFFALISNGEASLNLLEGKVEDLKTGKSIELSTFKGKPTILTFFQSGCERCHQLIEIFQCIDQKYPQKFNIIYLGTFSEKNKLARTVDEFKIPYPAYFAPEAYLKNLGGIKYTPYTFITDEFGFSRGKIGGGLPCKSLDEYLKVQKVL